MMTIKYRSKTAVSIASRAVHVGGHLATDWHGFTQIISDFLMLMLVIDAVGSDATRMSKSE